MILSFFVTCGRGLDDFVRREICEKIPGVMDVRSLGEGKIAFTIRTLDDVQSQSSDKKIGNSELQVDILQNNFKNCNTPGVKSNNQMDFNTEDVLFIYDLKLIERVFLLLHCETTNNCNSTDKIKVQAIMEKTDFDFIANLVSRMRNSQELQEQEYKGCCNPDSCPGFLAQRAAKDEIKQKRLQANTNNTGDIEQRSSVKRRNTFCYKDEVVRKKKKYKNIRESQQLVCEKFSQAEAPIHNCSTLFENSLVQKSKQHTDITIEESQEINHEYGIKSMLTDEKLMDHKVNKNLIVKDGCNMSITENHNRSLEGSLSVQKESIQVRSKSQDSFRETFPLTYRISCRITGMHKKLISSASFTAKFLEMLQNMKRNWTADWTNPSLDFYVNITDSYFILGVTLSRESRSLRSYIPHITLRSTIAHLIGKLCCIKPEDVLYDPMCGGGTILAEAGKCFKAGLIIGGDKSEKQLEIANCNLCKLGIPYSLLVCHSASVPLRSSSVDAIVCDFPFGQKHKVMEDEKTLLRVTLGECYRLLVNGGRAVFLLSSQQTNLVPRLLNSDNQLKLEATHPVSLGRTSAFVVVLFK